MGMNSTGKQQIACNPHLLSLDELLLKLHLHNHIKRLVNCAHLSCWGGGWWYFKLLQGNGRNCAGEFASIPGNRGTASERHPACGASLLHFAIQYIIHLHAPLLCKRDMMKRMSSVRNGTPSAPHPPPCCHKCSWRCSSAHWRKIPSIPILLNGPTWLFYISYAYAIEGWAGWCWWKMLIIDIVSCLQFRCTFSDLAHFEYILLPSIMPHSTHNC